jgi:hypothetical protein
MISQAELENATIAAANAAHFDHYTMGSLHEYDGVNGCVGVGVMLAVYYDANNITTLIKPLMNFKDRANAPNSKIRAIVGSIIADGQYVILVRPTTEYDRTSHQLQTYCTAPESTPASKAPEQPLRATTLRANVTITWERIQRMLPAIHAWLDTNGQQFFAHDDDTVDDVEWDADGQTKSPDDACMHVFVYSRSHAHRSTYNLYFDADYKPCDLVLSGDSDDCKACMHEHNEEQRLWSGPP